MSYFNFCYRNNENKTISVTSRGKTLGEVIDDFESFVKACGFKMDNLSLVLQSDIFEVGPDKPLDEDIQMELPLGKE